MTYDFDADPQFVATYEKGPRWFIPGYDAIHTMAAALLLERIGPRGHLLVLGAGGGAEITALARHGEWRFSGIDPSEQMLALAHHILAREGIEKTRVALTRGFIPDAPAGPFDGATCFLTLPFLPDDGTRLQGLKAIRQRLKPGAPFLMVHACGAQDAPEFAKTLSLYGRHGGLMGAPEEVVARAIEMNAGVLRILPEAREMALLAEAGFAKAESFYQGLMVKGWICEAAS
ncbi:MAG: methyltransferase domain-containing protein [Alphaproteobacteria bacterium]|nr:methyltransferase domain-containing protein [Alphaproteobacteria bacterium]